MADPETILKQAQAEAHRGRYRVQRVVQFVARIALVVIIGGAAWLALDLFAPINFQGRVLAAVGTAVLFILLFAGQAFLPKSRALGRLLGIIGLTVMGALYSYVRTHYST